MARAGAADEHPVDPPRALRPILRFTRLSTSALDAVRRVLDEHDDFRARVAAAGPSEEACGGRAGWLFVHRPEGWERELEELSVAASSAAASAAEEAEERTARRRLRSVEEAARRAEEELVRARAQLASAQAELLEERRTRRVVDEEHAALQARVGAAERERDAAHRRSTALAKEVVRLEAALVTAEEARAATPVVPPPVAAEPVVVEEEVGPAAAAFPLDELRAAVADAATAAAQLGRALTDAARALAQGDPPAVAPPVSPVRPPAAPPARRDRGPVRLPVPLPPGVFADDRAAADHLLRVPGTVLVVDGYNATLRRWPELSIAEQRRRLTDALVALGARTGAEVDLVFDGDEHAGGGSTAQPRRGLRITFSPGSVEADEVILGLVDRLPLARPVVVATDDRRVQREAAARGANVVTQAQLFAVLGLDR